MSYFFPPQMLGYVIQNARVKKHSYISIEAVSVAELAVGDGRLCWLRLEALVSLPLSLCHHSFYSSDVEHVRVAKNQLLIVIV